MIDDWIIIDEEEPLYKPSKEEEHHFWNGEGFITFFVEQNVSNGEYGHVFEFEVEDYDGCACGADETVGFDYLIRDMLDLDIKKLKEGYTYTIEGLTVAWFKGDGWTTDDDVEYDFEKLTYKIEWVRFIKQKLTNLWWQNIGWRLRK